MALHETVGTVATTILISILIFFTLFAGLGVAERLASRVRDQKRTQRQQTLRQEGLTSDELATVEPFIEYEIKHYSWSRPLVGLMAAISLLYLTGRASNTTGLVYAYGMLALMFGILTIVEVRRFLRARQVHKQLEVDPAGLASADDPFESFEYLRPDDVLTLGPDDE